MSWKIESLLKLKYNKCNVIVLSKTVQQFFFHQPFRWTTTNDDTTSKFCICSLKICGWDFSISLYNCKFQNVCKYSVYAVTQKICVGKTARNMQKNKNNCHKNLVLYNTFPCYLTTYRTIIEKNTNSRTSHGFEEPWRCYFLYWTKHIIFEMHFNVVFVEQTDFPRPRPFSQ